MNRRYRKTIIAGNWKMNKTPSETKAFAEQFKAILPKTKWCDIVVCAPTVDLSAAVRAFKDSRIAVGAENVYFEKSGAYTGEISADMLADLRCNADRMFNPDLVQLFVSKISCRLLTSRIIRLCESRDCCTCVHGLIRNIAHGANTF